ncbi:unnamed protein product [Ectocarpus sp. 13 AM-2016]
MEYTPTTPDRQVGARTKFRRSGMLTDIEGTSLGRNATPRPKVTAATAGIRQRKPGGPSISGTNLDAVLPIRRATVENMLLVFDVQRGALVVLARAAAGPTFEGTSHCQMVGTIRFVCGAPLGIFLIGRNL